MSRPSAAATDAGRTAAELLRVVGPMRRLLRRRIGEDWPLEPLPTAQLDLLRTVARMPGASVGQVAAELRVAPNTASTLVRRLVDAGLLERGADAGDRRAVRLELTAAAAERMSAWRDRRQQLLEAALEQGGEDDRRLIEAALPALRRLERRLDG